jgi:hypothetical protein
MSYGSPFTPKPGDVPLWPHGRAAEFDAIRDLAQRVAAGEVGDTNGLLIHGTQGIGKTALLNAASKQLADGGWQVAVISKYDSHDLSDIFRNSVDAQRMRGFAARARERSARLKGSVHGGSLSIGLLRGLGASVEIGPSKTSTDITQQLVDAGQRAARSARPAMILIDDLDNWSLSELRQLCNGLEQCSQAGSPVGVIATSAPAGDLRLARADRAGVFDARRLGPLTPSEAQAVLLHTAGARGIAIGPGAYERLLTFSQGHPQRLQLAAHEACKAMAPNSALLTVSAAHRGIERAIAKLDRQVYAPKWHMLTPAEQSVAQALASVGGNLPRDRAVLRAHTPRADRAQFEPACDALVRKDVVFEDAIGRLAFSNPGTEAWILRHRPPIGSPIHVLRGSPQQRPLSSLTAGSGRRAKQLGQGASADQRSRRGIGGP